MRKFPQIFKVSDSISDISKNELDLIKVLCNDEYNYYEDSANGYVAFELNTTNELAWGLVDELNAIDDSWYVGDEDEEYVNVQ